MESLTELWNTINNLYGAAGCLAAVVVISAKIWYNKQPKDRQDRIKAGINFIKKIFPKSAK